MPDEGRCPERAKLALPHREGMVSSYDHVSIADQGAFGKLLHRFGAVQAVFLFVGFVIFAVGLPGGLHLANRTMMTGICVMFCGIAGHYWSSPRYVDIFNGEVTIRGGFKWGRIFLGAIFAALAAGSAYFGYISN